MVPRIGDAKSRCKAWLQLLHFCRDSGDGANEKVCLGEAEAQVPQIVEPKFRDTQVEALVGLWLEKDDAGKALTACRAMLFTVRRVRVLVALADHATGKSDGSGAAAILAEAEAAARACPRPEDVFDGLCCLGRRQGKASDAPGARSWFLEAGACLGDIRAPGRRQQILAAEFAAIGEGEVAETIAHGIADPGIRVEMLRDQAAQGAAGGDPGQGRQKLEQALELVHAKRESKTKRDQLWRIALSFLDLGDTERGVAIFREIQNGKERTMAFLGYASACTVDSEDRVRFIEWGRRELESMPDGDLRQECQDYLQYLLDQGQPWPGAEGASRRMPGSGSTLAGVPPPPTGGGHPETKGGSARGDDPGLEGGENV